GPGTGRRPRSRRRARPRWDERRAPSSRHRQLDHAAADDRQLAVLIARFLLDLDEVAPALDALAHAGALDAQRVALGIVAADLAVRAAEDPVVAHPVGQVVRQPRAALRAVIVGARRAHHRRELMLPVHSLGTVGDAEAVLDPEPGVAVDLLPGELVGADVEAAPALRVGDEAGHRHRALRHR